MTTISLKPNTAVEDVWTFPGHGSQLIEGYISPGSPPQLGDDLDSTEVGLAFVASPPPARYVRMRTRLPPAGIPSGATISDIRANIRAQGAATRIDVNTGELDEVGDLSTSGEFISCDYVFPIASITTINVGATWTPGIIAQLNAGAWVFLQQSNDGASFVQDIEFLITYDGGPAVFRAPVIRQRQRADGLGLSSAPRMKSRAQATSLRRGPSGVA